MSIYLKLLNSNSAITAIDSAAQPKPARNPAVRPHCQSVFESPRKKARLYDIINARISVMPNTFKGLDDFSCSSVTPASFCHAFEKRMGEYQIAPRSRLLTALTATAK